MRKIVKIRWAVLGLPILLLASPLQAADLTREARVAEQISETILAGEPVWLQAGEQRFLAIYTPASTAKTRGAAILLHGHNAHPDWAEVIHPLRTRLPEWGWDTLSIQLPMSATDAPAGAWLSDLPLAATRIAAAAAWLKDRQPPSLALIGHSLGARMGAEYLGGLHGAPDPAFQAFVAIGLTANPAETDRGTLKALGQLRLPILDLYGERDLDGVLHGANARRRAALAAGTDTFTPDYTQVQVPGADHFFGGLDDLLISRVRAWLAKTHARF